MNTSLNFFPSGHAICYSGYRRGQSPGEKIFPSHAEIREDLILLQGNWHYLRLYDCSEHAVRVLQVIREHALNFKVMLGAYIAGEMSNPQCPWGAHLSEDEIQRNIQSNQRELERLVHLSTQYAEIVCAVAVGNEATVDWTDHLVSVDRMVSFVRFVKQRLKQPVTFCENYVPWVGKLAPLVPELDFLSIHTYPLWEYKTIDEAMDYTRSNVQAVAQKYPHKPIVVSEAGWATQSNGRGMPPAHANVEWQSIYVLELLRWSKAQSIPVFLFEAFDEPWKGSPDPLEPEKHWGIYTVDRLAKPVCDALLPLLRA
jgi:exo-beta-1,3-glucanase (GH17 family)